MDKSDYNKYLASREWALLKEQVKERSDGICERCQDNQASETHHITYERIGSERLDDLIHLCSECHKFLSAKSDYDPVKKYQDVATEIGQGFSIPFTSDDGMAWIYLTRLNFVVNAANYERDNSKNDPRDSMLERIAESLIYYECDNAKNIHLEHAKEHVIEAMRDLRAFKSERHEI